MKIDHRIKCACILVILGLTVSHWPFPLGVSNADPLQAVHSAPKLEARIKLNAPEIFPLEPLGVSLSLTNVGPAPAELSSGTWNMALFFRTGSNGEWQGYGKSSFGQTTVPAPRTKVLEINQSFSDYGILSTDRSGQGVFVSPGEYSVKAFLAGADSDSQKLIVVTPSGTNKAAFEELSRNGLYRLFDPEQVMIQFLNVGIKDSQVRAQKQNLANFIGKYPSSRYAAWAKLASLYLDEMVITAPILHRADSTPQERESLKVVRGRFELLALQLPKPLGALAWYEGGVVAAFSRDFGASKRLFDKAIQTDDTLIPRVANFNREYVGDLSSIKAGTSDASTIMKDTVSDLVAQGYDVKGFAKKYPDDYRAYTDQVAPLFQKQSRGEISLEECYRQVAILLKKAVTRRGKG